MDVGCRRHQAKNPHPVKWLLLYIKKIEMDALKDFFTWFLFYCAHPNNQIDGRPLYAYRCTDNLYGRAKKLIEQHLSRAIAGNAPHRFDMLFCLYCAETWRRHYTEGAWSYSLIFNTLNIETRLMTWPQDGNHQSIIRDWIAAGLQGWKRPLTVVNGHTIYLATISCEGGFPIHILSNHQGRFNGFLREAFQAMDLGRANQDFEPSSAIESIALRQLPITLRQPAIYSATANLVTAILELRDRVPDPVDRVNALNAIDPHWRRRLPLSGIPDDILRRLIDPLIKAPTVFCILRWKYILTKVKDEQWRLDRALNFPVRFTGNQLQTWLGDQPLPVRLRFMYSTGDTKTAMAHLTRVAGSDGESIYRCDPVINGPLNSGNQATKSVHVFLSYGANEKELDIEGINGLGDFPWAFTEINGEYCLAAEGSALVPGEQLWLAVLPDHDRQEPKPEHWAYQGEILDVGRCLYQSSSPAKIRLVDGDICEFHGKANETQEFSYSFTGPTLPIAYNSNPVYIGVPALSKIMSEQLGQPISRNLLRWKPAYDATSPWRSDFDNCFGTVWINYRNEHGVCYFRKRIHVLPNNSSVNIQRIGNPDQPGCIEFSGCRNPTITVSPIAGVQVTQESHHGLGSAQLLFFATGLPSTICKVQLNWANNRSLSLDLPTPCRGAIFSGEGYRAVQGQIVALNRLGAVRAMAQGLGQCTLVANVQAYDEGLRRQLWLRSPLIPIGNGQSRVDLHTLQEPLESMLALANSLDATAHLTIEHTGQAYATLTVAQFDVCFTPDQINNRILLTMDQVNLLEEGWQNRIQVRLIKLWEPDCDPIPLSRNLESDEVAWDVPDMLEAGPWWILGLDGNWARFRPLLWRVTSEQLIQEPLPERSLPSAIRISDQETRKTKIREVLSEMATDPNHPDWPRLFHYIELAAPYPASSLEVLRCFAREPRVQAMALIRSNEAQFGQVWNLAHQLPFSWHLLPANFWCMAAFDHFGTLRKTLENHGLDTRLAYEQFKSFKQLASRRQPFIEAISDWIRIGLFPFLAYPPEADELASMLALAMNNRQALLNRLEEAMQNLQGRQDEGAQWPMGHTILELSHLLPQLQRYPNQPQYRRPVLCAPFLAVHLNLNDITCSDDLLFDMRKLREFDREWFDEAFNLELCLQLANLPLPTEVTA
jgi:hypothetical protein